MCNVNYPEFPCRICAKNVHEKDKAVQCDLCKFWIHIMTLEYEYIFSKYLNILEVF